MATEYEARGQGYPLTRSDRPLVFTPTAERRLIFAIIRRYDHPWDHFAEAFEVCTATVRKIAHSLHGLHSCKHRAKPCWAMSLYCRGWNGQERLRGWIGAESSSAMSPPFELGKDINEARVIRPLGKAEPFEKQHLKITFRVARQSIMVWGDWVGFYATAGSARLLTRTASTRSFLPASVTYFRSSGHILALTSHFIRQGPSIRRRQRPFTQYRCGNRTTS